MSVERLSPKLARIVPEDADVQQLGSGYVAAEGPVWFHESGYLLFSDHRASRRYRWQPGADPQLIDDATGGGNGMTRDLEGRLVVCQNVARCLSRQEKDGSLTILAGSYDGRRLFRPNDVVVKSDGSVYFTDSGALTPDLDNNFPAVYRVSADGQTLTRVLDDLLLPNGLAFSPDESLLYVIDTQRNHIRAFDVLAGGDLANSRVFCQFPMSASKLPLSPAAPDSGQLPDGARPGYCDGMKLDVEGTIYTTAPGGVWIISPEGEHLGTISTGAHFHTNLGWGGDDWRTLFITTHETLNRIALNVPGIPVPRTLGR